MPDIHINIGLSRRPDNRGNATAADAKSLQAIQQLFTKPIKLGPPSLLASGAAR